jgi:hypothetical protein
MGNNRRPKNADKFFTEHGTLENSFYRAWNFLKKFSEAIPKPVAARSERGEMNDDAVYARVYRKPAVAPRNARRDGAIVIIRYRADSHVQKVLG